MPSWYKVITACSILAYLLGDAIGGRRRLDLSGVASDRVGLGRSRVILH
ncbi:MAG: hypothetical protein HC860_24140 [Alkalinema sp. RU_4_3]|nr:hypothetical protein [Alkalinema sp. RU_4_3]